MATTERCRQYAVRQWLTDPRGQESVLDVVRHLCGVQDQLAGNAFLAARARSEKANSKELQADLYDRRRLVRTWTVRGTIHVMAAEDLPLFRAALRPEWETRWSAFLNQHATREQREVAARAAMEVLKGGPATRTQLLAGVEQRLGIRAEWLTYLFSSWGGVLKDLTYKGEVVHGPYQGTEVCFVRTADWLGSGGAGNTIGNSIQEVDDALSALLVRYLQAYGPATIQDFAYWSGVTVARARRALELAAGRVRPVSTGGLKSRSSRFGELLDVPPALDFDGRNASLPAPVAFLPKFDPYLLAHKEKFYLAEAHYKKVFRPAADVAAVVLVRGEVVGTWRWERKGKRQRVAFSLFAPVEPDLQRRIEEEAERLAVEI